MTGEELKEILYKAHVSQAEMARALGISQQAFNATIKSADVKSSTLEKVAQALGCSVADFYAPAGTEITIKNTHVKDVKDSTIISGDNSTAQGDNSEVVKGLLEELKAQREQTSALIDIIRNKQA